MQPEERRNYTYLKALFDSLHSEALDYVNGGDSPEDRFERIKEIRTQVLALNAPVKIAAGFDSDPYGCPPGKYCVGGACVDGLIRLNWPHDGDPASWDEGAV